MKLTIYAGGRPLVAIGPHQVRLLAFAERFPGWHTRANDRPTRRAIEALTARGVLDVSGDQFRLNRGPRPVVAWTGGSRPRALSTISPGEAATLRALFRKQCATYAGAWGDLLPPSRVCPVSGRPVSRLDMARLFWRHARYDAHATYRGND